MILTFWDSALPLSAPLQLETFSMKAGVRYFYSEVLLAYARAATRLALT